MARQEIRPYTPEEIERWRSDLRRVIQPERSLLRFLATVDALRAENTRLKQVTQGDHSRFLATYCPTAYAKSVVDGLGIKLDTQRRPKVKGRRR